MKTKEMQIRVEDREGYEWGGACVTCWMLWGGTTTQPM